jgi:hypothetical protein
MTFDCVEKTGGYLYLKFWLLDEVSDWPLHLTDINSSDLTFTEVHDVIDAVVDEESIRIQERARSTKAGRLYQCSAEFDIVTMDQALERLLEFYQYKEGVLEVVDTNGKRKLFGTKDQPLKMNYSTAVGRTIESGVNTSITIEGETRQRAVYLNS